MRRAEDPSHETLIQAPATRHLAVSASVMPDGQTAVVLRGGPLESDLIVRQGALPVR